MSTLFDLDALSPPGQDTDDDALPPHLEAQVVWELKNLPVAKAGLGNFTPAAVRHVCAKRRMPVPLWAQRRDTEGSERRA
jgi:hypothetical protein